VSPSAESGRFCFALTFCHSYQPVAGTRQRRFDEAVALLAASLRQVPTYVTTAWVLASCYAHMGRMAEARKTIDHLRKIQALLGHQKKCSSIHGNEISLWKICNWQSNRPHD